MTDVGSKLVQGILDRGLASPDQIWGCSETEISEIAADQEVERLPGAYVEVLKRIGRGAGQTFAWQEFHYPGILGAKSKATEILEECGSPYRLPHNAFVVSLDGQTGDFEFFMVDEGDDPPIRHFGEIFSLLPSAPTRPFSQVIFDAVERWGEPLPTHEELRCELGYF